MLLEIEITPLRIAVGFLNEMIAIASHYSFRCNQKKRQLRLRIHCPLKQH